MLDPSKALFAGPTRCFDSCCWEDLSPWAGAEDAVSTTPRTAAASMLLRCQCCATRSAHAAALGSHNTAVRLRPTVCDDGAGLCWHLELHNRNSAAHTCAQNDRKSLYYIRLMRTCTCKRIRRQLCCCNPDQANCCACCAGSGCRWWKLCWCA